MVAIDRVTKLVRAEIRVVDEKQGKVHAIVSTEAKDRQGDIIRVAGWDLAQFNAHPVLVQSHDYRSVRSQIGDWEGMTVNPRKRTLEGDAIYYIGRGNPDADWGFQLARMGKAAYSVGFIPDMDKAKEIPREDGGDDFFFGPNYIFNGQKLLEVSHVVIPANPEALQAMKAMKTAEPMILELLDDILAGQEPPTDHGVLVGELSEELVKRLGISILQQRLDLVEAAVLKLQHPAITEPEEEPEARIPDLKEVIASWSRR